MKKTIIGLLLGMSISAIAASPFFRDRINFCEEVDRVAQAAHSMKVGGVSKNDFEKNIREYLKENPNFSESQKREIVAVIIESYVKGYSERFVRRCISTKEA
jgi:hypothetical protein